jgi:hypothetical protein
MTVVLSRQFYFWIPSDLSAEIGRRVVRGKSMSLDKEFIRDGKRRIIGSVTTGFVGSFETIVRDDQNNIAGSTSTVTT